jgi:2-desacetyl-2-hydroxyethyl bacteriochlorophyllide A dehydrogenase
VKAAVLDGPYRFRLEKKPLPALESGWVLIKVQAAGICGSDIHFYTGELPVVPGSVRGHEIAGLVVDPGKTELAREQAVLVHPLLGCNGCPACRRGQQQLCVDLKAIGGQYPGGFAEYVAAPLRNVYPFDPDRLPFTHAAFADGVAIAIHAANTVGLRGGESVVVLGDGAIGLLLLQVALVRGSNPVILVGKHKRNLEIARRLGASHALEGMRADVLSSVHNVTADVDVVFEAVGGPKPPLNTGLRMLRKGGRLAVLGLTGATDLDVPWIDVVLGEQSIIGTMGYGTFEGEDEMEQALDLMQSSKISLEPIITHQIPLRDVDRGFKMMLDRTRSHAIKVILLPHRATS